MTAPARFGGVDLPSRPEPGLPGSCGSCPPTSARQTGGIAETSERPRRVNRTPAGGRAVVSAAQLGRSTRPRSTNSRARKQPARPGSRRTRRSGRRAGWSKAANAAVGSGPPPRNRPRQQHRIGSRARARASRISSERRDVDGNSKTAVAGLPDVCRRPGQRAPRTGVAARAAPDSGSSQPDQVTPPTAASAELDQKPCKTSMQSLLLSTGRPARFAVLLRRRGAYDRPIVAVDVWIGAAARTRR